MQTLQVVGLASLTKIGYFSEYGIILTLRSSNLRLPAR